MTLIHNDFRSKIFWCATYSVSPFSITYSFDEPKIRELQVSRLVNEDILRFQISVYQIFAVQILKAKYYLSCIKSGEIYIQLFPRMDQLVKFSSIYIIHNEIERPRILLDAPQIYNEWMI
jgi:hypothetical protein